MVGRTLLVTAGLMLALMTVSARGAGDTTHLFMSARAQGYVKTPALYALIEANRDAFLSGAGYPDSGYWASGAGVPGGDYGEISHWEGFINAYVAHLRAKPECVPLSAPSGPCAPMVAHLLGSAAHGMGDEMWDWLFEPLVADHGESPTHPIGGRPPINQVPPFSLIDSIEYAMDMIAIKDHNLWAQIPSYVPDAGELEQVYRSMGHSHITADGILAGHVLETAILGAERAGAAIDAERIREQMPWSASHFYTESGGVLDSAQGIAGYLESIWLKLTLPTGRHPAPEVVAIHPEHGETGVPWQWLPARTAPGPSSGGGENRILAVLSNSVDPASVSASTFVLRDGLGNDVAALPGFPRLGPWGSDGTHSMLFYPAVDLQPCTVYTAIVTTGLKDHAGSSLRNEFRWSFETRPLGGAPRCA